MPGERQAPEFAWTNFGHVVELAHSGGSIKPLGRSWLRREGETERPVSVTGRGWDRWEPWEDRSR